VASRNSFGARADLRVGDRSFEVFRLDALASRFDVHRLPYSLKILLENLLRHEDGITVTDADIEALAGWDPDAEPSNEIAFAPARILMQDFTGVPAVVDLAAMRDAMAAMGGDPALVNPLIPAELVIDHSIIADVYGVPDAFAATRSSSSNATRSATDSCAGDRPRSTPSGSCHPTRASATRSTSSTWPGWSSTPTGRPIPTPSSAPIRTRR
jgi:aconitase A